MVRPRPLGWIRGRPRDAERWPAGSDPVGMGRLAGWATLYRVRTRESTTIWGSGGDGAFERWKVGVAFAVQAE